jgi:hypothetical protein
MLLLIPHGCIVVIFVEKFPLGMKFVMHNSMNVKEATRRLLTLE